jgi:ubiquinone/menaquinone biosynthesis C-methylase UbiE
MRQKTEIEQNVGQQQIQRTDLDKLFLIMGGHIFFQTLSAAVELDLFTLLSREKSMTRPQMAKRLKIKEKPIRILLSGLTALGLIKKTNEIYQNTPLAEEFLSQDSERSMAPIVRWQHHINYKPMFRFLDAMKANKNVGLEELPGPEKTLYGKLTRNPFLEGVFQRAMQSISVQANRDLAGHLDLSGVETLIDVGGGNGSNIISLAKANPHLKAGVFDSKTVCQIARENIKRNSLSDRLTTFTGECFKDNFPEGVDAIMFCHFFTIYSEEKNRQLLKKTYNALPKGGRVIIFNMMQRDDETGPLSTAMGSPYFLTLATGEGMLYTWNEYKTWIKEAGFSEVQTQALPLDHGVITGIKR